MDWGQGTGDGEVEFDGGLGGGTLISWFIVRGR